jgi:CMP-N-acetylneuraminic acid synthetase
MKNIIIIPAKKDSKRFPGKNWREINGKPLFELALERAKKSELGLVALVTNDLSMMSDKVFDLLDHLYSCHIIPKGFSEKRALDVCLWILEEMKNKGFEFDNILVTLPTSPLVSAEQMKEAYQLFLQQGRKTLTSFTPMRGRPRLWKNSINYHFSPLCEDIVWRDNGAIYIDQVDNFLNRREWFGPSVIPYLMDEITGVDVDTEWDYLIAKAFSDKIQRER